MQSVTMIYADNALAVAAARPGFNVSKNDIMKYDVGFNEAMNLHRFPSTKPTQQRAQGNALKYRLPSSSIVGLVTEKSTDMTSV